MTYDLAPASVKSFSSEKSEELPSRHLGRHSVAVAQFIEHFTHESLRLVLIYGLSTGPPVRNRERRHRLQSCQKVLVNRAPQ
jgi:hypothetical protein